VSDESYLTEAARHLGGAYLEHDVAAGTLRMSFTPRTEFANSHGNVHGGFIAAMLDVTLGSVVNAALAQDEPRAATLNLNVSYLRPLPLGHVIAEARIARRGRSVAFIEGSLRSETAGEVAATATMTLHLPAEMSH
jgi:uncharacterized protein (TIGR00369 family)